MKETFWTYVWEVIVYSFIIYVALIIIAALIKIATWEKQEILSIWYCLLIILIIDLIQYLYNLI